MKKWQIPQDVHNKDADQTVPLHNLMPRNVLLILTREFLSLIDFNHFRPPYLVVTSEKLLKSLIW